MTENYNIELLNEAQNSKWFGPGSAIIFGIGTVIFLTLLSGAVEKSTDILNLSNNFITTIRLASIGLGTGYYLGQSLKKESTDLTWYLLGVFVTLTALAANSKHFLIFGNYPSYLLLIIGGVLSIIANITPLVNNTEDYKDLVRYLTGYITTIIVVFISISDYLYSLIVSVSNWFSSLTLPEQAGIIILLVLLTIVLWGLTDVFIDSSKENN